MIVLQAKMAKSAISCRKISHTCMHLHLFKSQAQNLPDRSPEDWGIHNDHIRKREIHIT